MIQEFLKEYLIVDVKNELLKESLEELISISSENLTLNPILDLKSCFTHIYFIYKLKDKKNNLIEVSFDNFESSKMCNKDCIQWKNKSSLYHCFNFKALNYGSMKFSLKFCKINKVLSSTEYISKMYSAKDKSLVLFTISKFNDNKNNIIQKKCPGKIMKCRLKEQLVFINFYLQTFDIKILKNIVKFSYGASEDELNDLKLNRYKISILNSINLIIDKTNQSQSKEEKSSYYILKLIFILKV